MIGVSTKNAASGDAISNKNQSAKDRKSTERVVHVRVLRQDGPGQASYWERHEIPYELNMNVISILQRMRKNPAHRTVGRCRRWRGIATVWKRFVVPARWSSMDELAWPARRS